MNRSDLAQWLSAPSGCPPPEAFAAACGGELEPAARAQLEAHAAVCPLCEVERDLAGAFFESRGAELENADVSFVVGQLTERLPRAIPALARPAANVLSFSAPRAGSRAAATVAGRWNWQRLAAAAVLALGLGLGYRAWRPAELPDPSAGGAIRGGLLEARSPVGELEALPQRWSWTATADAADAAVYRVRLLAVDDTLLWQGETTATEIAPGESVAAIVHKAVRYRWSVTAIDGAGRVLAESPEAWFRLRPVTQ
jgi:hypothetical protein